MNEAERVIVGLKWRIDTTLGRTVHAQLDSIPRSGDPLIGVMDTASLAAHIVKLHNDGLAGVRELTDGPQSDRSR